MTRRAAAVLLLTALSAQAAKPKKKPKPPPAAVSPAPTPAPQPAPAPPAEPPPEAKPAPMPKAFRLAALGLSPVDVSQQEATLHTEVLAQRLQQLGVKVMTASDMTAVLGLERQRQLLGCAESDCMAEVGAALGVEALLVGTVGRLDGRYSLTVKVLRSSSAATLASWSAQGLSTRGLESALSRAAWELTAQLSMSGTGIDKPTTAPPEVLADQATSRPPWRLLSIIPAALGATGIGLGVYFHLQASSAWSALVPGISYEEGVRLRDSGTASQNFERASFAVGGTLLAAAIVMVVFGGESALTPVVTLESRGAGLAVVGRFP